jgi:hypothetical protein
MQEEAAIVARQGGLLPDAGGAMLAYLVATAAIAGLGGAFRARLPSYVAWIVSTVGLFIYLIRVCVRRGAFRSLLFGLLALGAATAATAVAAFLGLVVLVNIWMALGIPP